jgi:RNA-directed DNA polymerase
MDLPNLTTPNGAYAKQRNISQPAFNDALFDKVFSRDNMQQAWQQVKRNKGAAGCDGMRIEQFPDWAKTQWQHCKTHLYNGSYRPQPVKRIEIEKPDGGVRLLGIPTVIDRVIQQAINQVLTPIFDPTFSNFSFGFRPYRSGQQAARHVMTIIKQKRAIAVDVDLSKFFDCVNHDLLMSKLALKIQDKALLALIGRYLRAGVMIKGRFQRTTEGVPQGSPLSPLLSNILLDNLDKELESRGHQFARYADDFIILVRSKRAGERVLKSISRYLKERLKLTVNTRKSQVVLVNQSKFLGFTFTKRHIKWHPKTVKQFKYRVRQLTSRSWGVSMEYRLMKLRLYLRGWINYFGIANTYQQCVDLDEWIRRRVRMCYWKQWRRPRTKVSNLVKRGVALKHAISSGMTSKSYWRNAKTPAINQALNNDYLKREGLVSLRDGWIKCHYPNQ